MMLYFAATSSMYVYTV